MKIGLDKMEIINCCQHNIIKLIVLLFIALFLTNIKTKIIIHRSLGFYRHYLRICTNKKLNNNSRNQIDNPFVSICLPAYNMEKYIEQSLLSIIKQSFNNFEIIIVDDYSNDKTKYLIERLQLKDNRIRFIKHSQNLGVYTSRVDAILASRGEYIILMDPDDMLLNPILLELLYNYNLKYNLDIIEYTVICFIEKKNTLKIIEKYYHYHSFLKKIIYQPELSDLFFYYPNSKNYSHVQCRVIWNKIIRRKVLLNSIHYIGEDYYRKFFITAEDTIINLICLNFAQNYTNINMPGYMYNIREISMTHGKSNKNKRILFYYNHLLYLNKIYTFFKDFNKNRNFLINELLDINKFILKLNKLSKEYKQEILDFYKDILNDKYISKSFKQYYILNFITNITRNYSYYYFK